MIPSISVLEEPPIANSFLIDRIQIEAFDSDLLTRLYYHRIFLVERGTGTLNVDASSFKIKNNQLILLSKGQLYGFDDTAAITGYLISFGDCFWEKTPSSASNCKAVLFNNAAANQRLFPSEEEMNVLKELFNDLLKEYRLPLYPNQMDAMAAYLKIIMIKLANVQLITEGIIDTQDYIIYRKFMDLLSSQYQHNHAVRDYADMLNITARRLSELCRRCANKSAKEIINGQIIAEAKRSLQFSTISIKEIAYLLSFSTPEQFSHFFKKNMGMSPASYRSHSIGSLC